MRIRRLLTPKGNLWHHQHFLMFWTGDTITQFTGQISGLALAVVAIDTLKVTKFEYGLIGALGFIAFPTLGLFVGVWMDRIRRKPVMIAANLIQVVSLASVPLAFIFGMLGLFQLYAVSLIMGTTTLFFDVAYQSYLPSLVNKEDVIEGNQKLQTSASAAQVAGPSVSSAAMALVGAAQSVAVDAIGTLAAAFMLIFIKKPEPKPAQKPERKIELDSKAGLRQRLLQRLRQRLQRLRQFFVEMKEGIKVITGNKLLWTQAGCTGTSNLGSQMFYVAATLYALRTFAIPPGIIGISFSIGAVGFLIGVLISSTVTSKLGLGRTVALSMAGNFGLLIVLLANSSLAVPIFGIAFFVGSLGIPAYNINLVSLRQIITPNRLQGRMNATMRTIVWGTIPVGSLLGGIFCTSFGIIPTIIIGAVIAGSALLWIVLGPIFKLKKHPEPAGD